jgi:hypothetical protein
MLSVLLSCLLALAAAQGGNPAVKAPAADQAQSDKLLDELIAKTSKLKSFTAVYEMQLVMTGESAETAPVRTMRIDYQAPDKMRVDVGTGSEHLWQWLVGGVLALQEEGEKPLNGRIDTRAIGAEFAHLYQVLGEAFPDANSPSGQPGPVVVMSWSFDEPAQKANFNLSLVNDRAARTPLGWLTELRDRDEKSSESDSQLLFNIDGHIKVAISKSSGFVESFSGKSPRGEMRVQLKSLETDNPIDAQRFVLPSESSGEGEAATEMRDAFRASRAMACRYFVYRRIGSMAGAEWTDAERSKIDTVFRAYHEYDMRHAFDILRKAAEQHRERLVTRLRKLREDGHSEEEVASERDAMIADLQESLDKQINGYLERLTVPEHSPPFPRGDDLLKLEREVATKVFDELVRAPMVHDFEQATSLEKK